MRGKLWRRQLLIALGLRGALCCDCIAFALLRRDVGKLRVLQQLRASGFFTLFVGFRHSRKQIAKGRAESCK